MCDEVMRRIFATHSEFRGGQIRLAKKCALNGKGRVEAIWRSSYVECVIVAEALENTTAPSETPLKIKKLAAQRPILSPETAFGCPREFLRNRFVYVVVSPRARGLSVGVNMNPDRQCNFNCVYCEVRRDAPVVYATLDVDAMEVELKETLAFVRAGRLREVQAYRGLSDELLQLRHVALSGDGEPTLSPTFTEALQAVVHVRALSEPPFFKLVLITNGTGLDLRHVQQGLESFTKSDEVWIKLDGGTRAYVNKVNQTDVPLERILANIVLTGRKRPVIIQSLFPAIRGEEPPDEEIDQYAQQLLALKAAGTQISLVQIYSATRPVTNPDCGHLKLKVLSRIAQTVRLTTGLKAEVF
jgi:wyosine [tRNA(Phe)-imidazoG37] synthetase (radical SAM superfamily)